MIKALILSITLAVSSLAMASNRTSCVIQVLKNNTNGQKAHFVFACGQETLAVHYITPLDQQSAEQVAELKSGFMQVLKQTVGGAPTCFESDTELFWIGICHQ